MLTTVNFSIGPLRDISWVTDIMQPKNVFSLPFENASSNEKAVLAESTQKTLFTMTLFTKLEIPVTNHVDFLDGSDFCCFDNEKEAKKQIPSRI